MDSEAQNDFDREIETLKSMFGELVSTAVIVAVLESCNGDVNLAAEGIMSMVCDGPDPTETDNNAIALSYPVNELQSCQVMPSDDNAICLVDTTAKIVQEPVCPPKSPTLEALGNEVNNDHPTQNPNLTSTANPPSVSYVAAFKSTGAVPKIRDNTNNDNNINNYRHANNTSWNDQLKRILNYHNQGSRVMIIMRGVPGSGKSTLAQQIVEMTVSGTYQNFNTHIFCSDDYFLVRGKYQYDRNYLQEAHQTNQRNVYNATNQGLSPVIVDNTNVRIWEMEPYVRDAVRNGYYIEIVEPNTPWVRNATQLSRRNKHNVPKDKIRRMLDDYDKDVTATILMRTFRLRYPINKTPPIKRNSPPFPEVPMTLTSCNNNFELPHSYHMQPATEQSGEDVVDANTSQAHTLTSDMNIDNISNVDSKMFVIPNETEMKRSEEKNTNTDSGVLESKEDSSKRLDKRLEVIIEAQKKLEEIENLEKEWENGESWVTETTQAEINNTPNVPKPPRNIQNLDEDTKMIEPFTFCDDWSKISMFMPPWQDNNASSLANQNAIHALVTATKSTSMEIGDANNVIGLFKVVNCTSRNINEGNDYEDKKERIPDQRMLDKSTSTHEGALPATHKCKNEEQHFIAFRKMFKHVPRPILRDVFDKCLGDVNWAVNIVLDGMSDNEISTLRSEELSDTEEETIEQCDCLAAYNIIPDMTSSSQEVSVPIEVSQSSSVNNSPMHGLQKKLKRERKISENEKILELKRQIENNVMISDNHYSQHYLNLRRSRRENDLKPSPTNSTNSEENLDATSNVGNLNESSEYPLLTNDRTSQDSVIINEQVNEPAVAYSAMDPGPPSDYDNGSPTSEPESVSINLGTDFVNKLDELFGRQDIIYPENVKPIVSVPISLLREINAIWAESIAFQMDSASKQTKEMIQEDEEFARELLSKERELAQEGKESQVPDFKEIMDMDLALSIYEKGIAEWRTNEPQDLAAKMSRNKLYGLFPDVFKDLLDELLMAHDNNFQATVESLLMSTGQGHVLNVTNGVNKFIMEMEMQKKEILLEEERRSLSDEEWPYLGRSNAVVTMDEVTHYRDEAQRYLDARNVNRTKALYHASRNQFSVAAFYTDIAAYNVRRFEQANSRAAVSLVQYHATNRNENDLIDLHYMRVAEAKETLDLFIDNQIQRLRDYKKATGKEPEAIDIYFITGRGIHSQGLPRIKPAVKKRLTDRDLVPRQRNPGLISTIISLHSLMTHELNRDR